MEFVTYQLHVFQTEGFIIFSLYKSKIQVIIRIKWNDRSLYNSKKKTKTNIGRCKTLI